MYICGELQSFSLSRVLCLSLCQYYLLRCLALANSLSLCPFVFRANRSEHAFFSLGLMIILRNISQMMLRRKNMIHSRWRLRGQRWRQPEDSHAERIMSSNSIDNETSEAVDESAGQNGVTSSFLSLSLPQPMKTARYQHLIGQPTSIYNYLIRRTIINQSNRLIATSWDVAMDVNVLLDECSSRAIQSAYWQ